MTFTCQSPPAIQYQTPTAKDLEKEITMAGS